MLDAETNTPFISIPGVLNFRDIGGYSIPSQPGKEIRQGVVYRSAEPYQLTEAGYERIQQLRIAAVYDLRSEREVSGADKGSPFSGWTGTKKIFAPVFRKEDYSPEAVALRFKTHRARPEGFAEAYSAILAAAAHPENEARPYASILEHLAMSADPEPILIHCQAGKDRTAVICALILSLCGVEDNVVADEYSLTDIGLRSRHEELVANLLSKEEFRGDPEGARQMILARRDNMLLFLRKIRREYSSVEQCIVDLKLLTAEGIERLRSNMIVDVTK
ncbi:tyrosine phosphatase [Xylariaceae sp. FL1651]|nr:tyrosine phosphatase [Xylariaceae sp. FL1651]